MMKRFFLFFSLLIFVFWSCKKDKDEEEEEYIILNLDEYVRDNFPDAQLTEDGVYVYITTEGNGPKPTEEEKLYTYYKRSLLTGEVLDSVIRSSNPEIPEFPYTFYFNTSSVIKGLDRGVAQLNKGSKAILLIPDSLAYGDIKKDNIPPNSPLRYDVELLYVE